MEADREKRSSLEGTYTFVTVVKTPRRPGSTGDRSRKIDRIVAQASVILSRVAVGDHNELDVEQSVFP